MIECSTHPLKPVQLLELSPSQYVDLQHAGVRRQKLTCRLEEASNNGKKNTLQTLQARQFLDQISNIHRHFFDLSVVEPLEFT